MHIWWVNQGGTFEISKRYSCLWSPIKTSRGIALTYWNTMAEVRKGDIIVHCSKGKILAIGKAFSDAYIASQPAGFQSDSWGDNEGRRVDVEYFTLNSTILVSDVAAAIQELNIHQGPLNKHGKPKQSYLHRFSLTGLNLLREASSSKWPEWAEQLLERFN